MGVSLKQIAERLNLSIATVSWTLNDLGDKKNISRKTQERVRQCAREMNYKPNLLARGLNTGKSSILGLIIPDITDAFYSTMARRIEKEAERAGYSLMICNSDSSQAQEDRMLTMFLSKQVDGIIIAPTKLSRNKILKLQEDGYPIVTFDRVFEDANINSVVVDNFEASYNIVNSMVRHGARHIAIITTNQYLYTMNLRYMGYKAALEENGLQVVESLMADIPFNNYEKNIIDALDSIYRHEPKVDGFFFTTPILALEAFRYFFDHKININDGYQLGCIHAIPALRILCPSMRIAMMPVDEIGTNTVRIVTECIDTKKLGIKRTVEKVVCKCSYTDADNLENE